MTRQRGCWMLVPEEVHVRTLPPCCLFDDYRLRAHNESPREI